MGVLSTKKGYVLLGSLGGLLMAILAWNGNPANMALCVACFIRDMAGSLKLHNAAVVQYFRPEIIGLIIGAFIISKVSGEFQATGSGSTPIRFFLGMIMMICALVFLGCPLRMVLRMAAGDGSAYVGLVGFLGGLGTGTFFLKRGFTLGEEVKTERAIHGYVFPITMALIMITVMIWAWPVASVKGPGSMHAAVALSLGVGILFGCIAQKTRMCFSGAFRNAMAFGDFTRLGTVIGLFIIMVLYNVMTGHFKMAAFGPIAHGDMLWNILSMYGVGLAATLAGGCPLRHVILAGTGSGDSVVTVLGLVVGAAIAHNFGLAATAGVVGQTVGGPSVFGQGAVIVSIVALFIIGFAGRVRN